MTENDTAPPAEPRRRNRRTTERKKYADLYADLRSRVGFATTTLREAADASPEVCKALLNIALTTLTTED